MGTVVNFDEAGPSALEARRKKANAARQIKNRNDDLIARYRPKPPPAPDPTHDLRAIQEYNEPRLHLISFQTEDDFPPPICS